MLTNCSTYFFTSPKIKTPVSILKEQASLLGEKTKNLLKAEVKLIEPNFGDLSDPVRRMFGGQELFHYAFYFIAPTLNNYRYKLFTISHDIQLYPIKIDLDDDVKLEVSVGDIGKPLIAQSENEFLEILRKIFNANKTKQIMTSILGQTSFEPG